MQFVEPDDQKMFGIESCPQVPEEENSQIRAEPWFHAASSGSFGQSREARIKLFSFFEIVLEQSRGLPNAEFLRPRRQGAVGRNLIMRKLLARSDKRGVQRGVAAKIFGDAQCFINEASEAVTGFVLWRHGNGGENLVKSGNVAIALFRMLSKGTLQFRGLR